MVYLWKPNHGNNGLAFLWSTMAILLLLSIHTATALLADDAGLLDVHLATTGHGVTRFVQYVPGTATAVDTDTADDSLITSDSPAQGHQLEATAALAETSCFVACRHWQSGTLKWRRNVCSTSQQQQQQHAVTSSPQDNQWFSMDTAGIVRAWTMDAGQLLWDALTVPTNQPRLSILVDDEEDKLYLAVFGDSLLTLLDATTGKTVATHNAVDVLPRQKNKGDEPRWLAVVPTSEAGPTKPQLVAAWVHTSHQTGLLATSGTQMTVVECSGKDWTETVTTKLPQPPHHTIAVSSLQWRPTRALAMSEDGLAIVVLALPQNNNNNDEAAVGTKVVDVDANFHPTWRRVLSIQPLLTTTGTTEAAPSGMVVQVVGVDHENRKSMALYNSITWQRSTQCTASPTVSAITMGHPNDITVALESQHPSDPPVMKVCAQNQDSFVPVNVKVVDHDNHGKYLENDYDWAHLLLGIVSSPGADGTNSPFITAFAMVARNTHYYQFVLATSKGTTTHLQVELVDDTLDAKVSRKWTTEEGLGSLTSALVLDASHAVVVDDLAPDDNNDAAHHEMVQRLTLTSRLASQGQSIMARLLLDPSSSSSTERKDRLFGFLKMAVLVSESVHRLYGLSLAGPNRGSVAWMVDLPARAQWHKLVHGTTNSPKAVHGINGGTHSREVLVVSALPESLEWHCVDGTHGQVHGQGSIPIKSPIVQVIPLLGGGACRQHALVVHENQSLTLVPNDDATKASALQQLEASPNGMFAHIIDSAVGTTPQLKALQIVHTPDQTQEFSTQLVGQTSFVGERLVKVVYPLRDEVVQSPCTVLGDDSLLLKYLNPHLAVMITMRNDDSGEDPFGVALAKAKPDSTKKQAKKPVGVTPKGAGKENTTDTAAPTAEAADANLFVNVVDTVSGRILYRASHANVAPTSKVHAVISENWIVYSFLSGKTRKTEVGVLTLHEGMIHRKGLTAFTAPEQTETFSSWDARESKPVVLAKTYSLPKPVSAMGVTNTRGGISSHQLLIATADDRLFAVERRMLDTRRPLSELKETEKQEGLKQYSELIPLVSFQSISYNLTVEAPTAILSAPTELESQTLVFAYGGPDIFFTRTSPSKGFDMLPESFNRILLSLLVVALVTVVFVTKKMATQKMVKQGWT